MCTVHTLVQGHVYHSVASALLLSKCLPTEETNCCDFESGVFYSARSPLNDVPSWFSTHVRAQLFCDAAWSKRCPSADPVHVVAGWPPCSSFSLEEAASMTF